MKTKLLAITLSLLCLVQPVAALGIVGVESAAETVVSAEIPAEDATLAATEFPNAAPANAVIYEDFENVKVSSSKTAVTYVKEGYEGATVAPCAQWVTAVTEAPVKKGKSWHINVNNFNYGGSVRIQGVNIMDVGKYNISFKVYPDFDTSVFITTKYFIRFWNPSNASGKFFDSSWVIDNTRQTWLTKSYDFEIYETDGVKYIKHGSTVKELDASGITGIEMYSEISPKSETVTAPIYFDDICLTYEAPLNISFKDANGESFAYDVAEGYAPLLVTMPTAEALGLGYEPQFTDNDGNVYVPGQTATVTKDTVFTVGKSNILLYDTYETHELTGWKLSSDVAYRRGEMAGATISNTKIYNYDGGKAFRQDGIAVIPSLNLNGQLALLANKLTITKPGKYTISYDVGLDTVVEKGPSGNAVEADSITITTRATASYGVGGKAVVISRANPKASLTVTVELYHRESDGALCFKSSGGTEVAVSNGVLTNFRVAMEPTYSNENPDDRAKHFVFIDNFKIEFEPYAPSAIPMVSYRAPDADYAASGIRFAASVSDTQKADAAEYGYVVTRKTLLEEKVTADESYETYLHLGGISSVSATGTTTAENSDGVMVAAAAAYNGNINRVYTMDASIFDNGTISFRGVMETFFTGVVTGMTSDAQKAEVIVARPYIKVDGVYYYGDCYETSYNDIYEKANA